MEWKDRICVGWMRVLCGSLLGGGMRADAKARQQSGERGTSGTRAVGSVGYGKCHGEGEWKKAAARTYLVWDADLCGERTYDLGETSTMHTS